MFFGCLAYSGIRSDLRGDEAMAGDGLVAGEDWAVVAALLPAGWREQAKATGALVRNRNFSGADALAACADDSS